MKFYFWFISLLLISAFSNAQNIEKKRLYLGNDTHVDLMYNGTEEQWSKNILEMADFYLNLGESTQKETVDRRSKWNYDVAYWLYVLEKKRSPEYFQRIIDQIKNQQASVPYNFTLPIYGASTSESILRGFYYSGYLQRKYGIEVELAVCQENATIPLGLSSLWAGSGAKYSWKGVCNCASKTNTKGRRRNEMYWYTGLDDSKILMKWYSNWGWNAEIGGYAELLEPTHATMQLDTLCDSKAYPFRIAAAFGKGWDNMINYSYDLQWGMNHRTRPGTQVFISNELDFFRDFEANYGDKIKRETVAYGNEWDLLPATLAETSAGVKRAMEKLRTAEAMAAIACKNNPEMLDQFKPSKDDFMLAISMYNAHGWTIDGPIKKPDFAIWAKKQQKAIQKYVDTLYDFAAQKLGENINSEGKQKRFYVFNPLNWNRDELVKLPAAFTDVKSVKDVSTGEIISVQKGVIEGKESCKFLAKNIPSVGYKVFELSSQSSKITTPFSFKNNVIQTPLYTVKISNGGEIISLIDKKTKREWVKEIDGKFMNDLGKGLNENGSPETIEMGLNSISIRCKGIIPLKYETKITFYAQNPRIDFENKIVQNFGDDTYWTFSVNEDNPSVWHEEIGAIIKVKTEDKGGHYSSQNARYDHQSLNHFVSVNGNNGGLSISNRDCLFMKLGNSTPTFLDQNSSQINVLVGGQIDKEFRLGIVNQDGDSLFVQHFSILPQSQTTDNVQAMKFSMEHQNPLVVQVLNGNGKFNSNNQSFFTSNDTNSILWVLKPGEESGTVGRLWNVENRPKTVGFQFDNSVKNAQEVTHVETPKDKLTTTNGAINLDFKANQMKSFQVFFNR